MGRARSCDLGPVRTLAIVAIGLSVGACHDDPAASSDGMGLQSVPALEVQWTDDLPSIDLTGPDAGVVLDLPEFAAGRRIIPGSALRITPDTVAVRGDATGIHLISWSGSKVIGSTSAPLRGAASMVRGADSDIFVPLAEGTIVRMDARLEGIDTIRVDGTLVGGLVDGSLLFVDTRPGSERPSDGARAEQVEVRLVREGLGTPVVLARGTREVGGSLAPAWGSIVLAGSGGCEIWVSPDGGHELRRFDSDGAMELRLLGVPGATHAGPASFDELKSRIETRLRAREDSGMSVDFIRRELDVAEPWRDLRSIVDLRVTDAGSVWVRPLPPVHPFMPTEMVWVGFDREGRGIGRIVLPGHLRVLDLQRSHVVASDILQPRSLHLYALDWPNRSPRERAQGLGEPDCRVN